METNWRLKYGAQVALDPSVAAPRWSGAEGHDVHKSILEFNDVSGGVELGTPNWVVTKVQTGAGSSTFAGLAGQGGLAIITTDDAINDGVNAQYGSGAFKPSSTSDIYFGCNFEVDEATDVEYFIGLAILQTNILGAPASAMMGFRKAAAATDVAAVIAKSSVETELTPILVQDAAVRHTLEFEFVGANRRVYFYVDGEATETRMASFANIPDASLLLPSIHFRTKETAAHTFTVDYLRSIQMGRQ